MLTFDELRNKGEARSERWGSNEKWDLADWMVALTGELGEAANIVKKLKRAEDGLVGNKETVEELLVKLRREFGDIQIYLDHVARAAGVDLAAATVEVFNAKSEQLGFPERLAE
jgi:NTP pyrophosphatase (non-canonical NTP hydrolase)